MSFTYHYSQPAEYRFSLDSIQAAKLISEEIKSEEINKDFAVLDLCAGCGVMGFELSFFQPQIQNFDFVEIQEIYAEHFQENLRTINRPELNCRWLQMNYDQLIEPQFKEKYDLIIANPPYFQMGQGKLSPSEFKNRCRFFIDSTFQKFILAMVNSLKKNAQAYFLLRPLQDHNLDHVQEMVSILPENFTYEKLADIRGTELFKITKK